MNAREPFVVGDWAVDPATGTLTGPAGERRMTPKLTDLLLALVERAGRVVSRDELLRNVWGERSVVSDEPLTRAVAELRKVLGDVRADPNYIETIPKRGYRLIAPVRLAAPAARTPGAGSAAGVAMQQSVQPAAERPTAPVHEPSTSSAFEPRTVPAAEPVAVPAMRSEDGSPDEAVARVEREPPSMRPAAAPRRRWHLAALAALVAGVAITLAVVALRTPPATEPARTVGVAVLPLADLSPAADRQYFADGVHEEIIARLTGIRGLRVSAHSAVAGYREPGKPPGEVARELGVDAVMVGTVRYSDARVRVTAQLIDAATDTHLWAEVYDRPLTLENLFDIQAEIAEQVAAGLVRSLAITDARRDATLPTGSLPAYEAFLLGKYHYRRHQPGDIRIAVEQFQAAADADAAFAEAWDWLAYAWNEAGVDLDWTTPAQAFPRARAAALRALELDPKLATSSALLGFLRATYDREWEAGLAELERAVAAAPGETGTVWSYAYVLSLLGRHDEAIGQVRRLAAAFPEDGRLKQEMAERCIDAGRFTEAAEAASAALASGAEPGQVRELLGIAAFGSGDLETALVELERAVALHQGAGPAVGRLAAAYARAGRADDARALLRELEARGAGEQVNAATLARVHAALGESERALALLEQGLEQRQRDVLGIRNDPFLVPLRHDPRFAHIVESAGLASPAASR